MYRTPADDAARDLSAEAFFTILVDYVCNFAFRVLIDYCRCTEFLSVIHAHIQRSIFLEAEASFRIVKLHARDSEVGQNATIDSADADRVQMIGNVAVVSVHIRCGIRKPHSYLVKRSFVLVDSDQSSGRPHLFPDRLKVSACTDCGVHVSKTRTNIQRFQALVK